MHQKAPELLQHFLLGLGQLELGGVALDRVERAACAGHGRLVTILAGPVKQGNKVVKVQGEKYTDLLHPRSMRS